MVRRGLAGGNAGALKRALGCWALAGCFPNPDDLRQGGTASCASTRCTAVGGGCGQCAARGTAGAVCTSDSDCAPSLLCTASGTTTGICVTPVGSGLARNPATTPCRRSLSCRNGTCQAPGRIGTACDDIEDCDEPHGYLCNATTRLCALATGGATCNLSASDGNVQYCSAGGLCTATGPCVPAAADTQACSPSGAQCVYPATCTGGICVLPSGADCP